MTKKEIKDAYVATKAFKTAKIDAFLAINDQLCASLTDLLADIPDEAEGEMFVQAMRSLLYNLTESYMTKGLRTPAPPAV